MEPENNGFQKDFPFQPDLFSGSMLNFGGVLSEQFGVSNTISTNCQPGFELMKFVGVPKPFNFPWSSCVRVCELGWSQAEAATLVGWLPSHVTLLMLMWRDQSDDCWIFGFGAIRTYLFNGLWKSFGRWKGQHTQADSECVSFGMARSFKWLQH